MNINYVVGSLKKLKEMLVPFLIKQNFEGLGQEDADEFSEHFGLAISALEKQVPEKPINQSTWKACPACTQGIGVDNNTPNPKAIEYCFHCGQKLDWD